MKQSDDYKAFLELIKSLYLMENGVTKRAVAGDVLDGCFHNLLMDLLQERNIRKGYVEKLTDFSTACEHNLYIALLESTKKIVSWI